MTYVPNANREDLMKITEGTEPLIIDTNIPWAAHHDGTVILGRKWNGHVFLRVNCHRNPEVYHLGDASGMNSPIFLRSFKEPPQKSAPVIVHISQIIDVVLRRFHSQLVEKPIPDVLSVEHEAIARSVLKFIASKEGLLDKWINMEQLRCQHIIEYYNIENIKLIYPMIQTQDTWAEDIKQAYIDGSIKPIVVPDIQIFSWVNDVLNNF
tara:strand:- start:520 stop:1146 length:627 start_codon:yes stop_codon:yes gene_type:complete